MFNEISGSSIIKIVASSADVIVLTNNRSNYFSPLESQLKLIGSLSNVRFNEKPVDR